MTETEGGVFLSRLNHLIAYHPWVVIGVFFLLSVALVSGVGGGGDDQVGADQFVEELPEYQALQDMQDDFARADGRPTGHNSITLYVSDDDNVLSRASLLRMLEFQERMERRQPRVESTMSPASGVANVVVLTALARTLEDPHPALSSLAAPSIDGPGAVPQVSPETDLAILEAVADDVDPDASDAELLAAVGVEGGEEALVAALPEVGAGDPSALAGGDGETLLSTLLEGAGGDGTDGLGDAAFLAETLEQQRLVLERAPDRALHRGVVEAYERDLLGPVSVDFNHAAGSASVAHVAVTFDTAPAADQPHHTDLEYEAVEVADGVEGFEAGENAVVVGGGIVQSEINQLLIDTRNLVFPAAIGLIVVILLVAYRDPFDVFLGLLTLVLTLLWVFGFMGHAGIPFSDAIIPVFPLLLAVGIDFGIHIINRYREERARGVPIPEAMSITTNQLSVAFLIVTLTTVFGLAANLTSPLDVLQDFGILASAGMVFTFCLFGIFLPACKVALDGLREGTLLDRFGASPLGTGESTLGRALQAGTRLARFAPAIVLVTALVAGAAMGAYGTGIETEFSEEEFFPEQDRIDRYQSFPEPLRPEQYTFLRMVEHLEEDFEQGWVGTVTVYAQDSAVRSDVALEDVDRALQNPPDAFESDDRRAEAGSILDAVDAYAAQNEDFARLVAASDTTGSGVPDRNVERIYDELLAADGSDVDEGGLSWEDAWVPANQYLTEDRTGTRIVYALHVETDGPMAAEAATEVTDRMRLDATPTGQMVIEQSVIELITESALRSLAVAFVLTAIFLLATYRWLEGRAMYGAINLVPVLFVVAALAGSMRAFDIAFSPFNAPILAVSIGLGVDYTVHFMHRFVDEFEDGADLEAALATTMAGTGGALTGSMVTTVCGLGVLYFAVIPLLSEFGLLLALGVLYAYLAAVLVLPSTIVVWYRLDRRLAGSRFDRPASPVEWLR